MSYGEFVCLDPFGKVRVWDKPVTFRAGVAWRGVAGEEGGRRCKLCVDKGR